MDSYGNAIYLTPMVLGAHGVGVCRRLAISRGSLGRNHADDVGCAVRFAGADTENRQ